MSSVFSENLRIYNAEQFKQSISELGPTSIYLTIGKVRPWDNDAEPPQADSGVGTFNEVWQQMIAAKLIVGSDVRHAIRRINWTSDTVYDAYDHCTCTLLLFNDDVEFFVLTTDWNIYKCLYNNNGGQSTVMPTQTIVDAAVEEQDGYIWKYMYTLTAEERIRFMTDSYIPVRTLLADNNSLQWQVQESATPGSIDIIKVVDGGSNYSNASTITVTIAGDGVGATARAKINSSSNTVSSITMINRGLNYTYATISITDSGTGSGATANAVISPPGGHGSDPMRELGGSYLMLNPRIKSSEDGKISINNEYRQIALIQDPVVVGTGNIASNTVYTQVAKLTMSPSGSEFIEDEYVYQGESLLSSTFKGLVVDWNSGNNILQLTDTTGIITSVILNGATSGASRFVESITEKELRPYSGNLLYVDNIVPIERAIDQTEDYKILLKF
jgi:hypothetical protein